LGESTGFKVVKRFYHLYKEPDHVSVKLEEVEPRLPDVEPVPVGWKFLKKCDGTPGWLSDHARAYKIDDEGFLLPKEPATIFTPFSYRRIEHALDGMQTLAFQEGRKVGIMVPEDMPSVAEALRRRGFTQWELEEPDILVFELDLVSRKL